MNNSEYFEIILPDDFEHIREDGACLEISYQFKHNNGIWRVHNNDPDDIFPSAFHADRVDKAEKLDLYTGSVYSKINKELLYNLPAKVMKYMY